MSYVVKRQKHTQKCKYMALSASSRGFSSEGKGKSAFLRLAPPQGKIVLVNIQRKNVFWTRTRIFSMVRYVIGSGQSLFDFEILENQVKILTFLLRFRRVIM